MRTVRSEEHRAVLVKLRHARRRWQRAIDRDRHRQALSLRAEIAALEAAVAQHEAEFQERLAASRERWEALRGNLATLKAIDPSKRDAVALRQRRKQEALGKRFPAEQTARASSGSTRARVNWAGTPEAECWPADASCRDPQCTDYKHSAGPGCAESGKYAHPSRRRQ